MCIERVASLLCGSFCKCNFFFSSIKSFLEKVCVQIVKPFGENLGFWTIQNKLFRQFPKNGPKRQILQIINERKLDSIKNIKQCI